MIQTILGLIAGKLISFITQLFNIGGGSAAPGLYALKFNPNLITFISAQIQTNIIITGTNGKTTTSKLIEHLLIRQGVKTIRNKTGSNLERGIASTLVKKTNLFGILPETDVGIWEVDEAAFNSVAPKIQPKIIVFLNAFRDQLDRYGEVNSVVSKWEKTLSKLSSETLIIANGDDTNTSHFTDNLSLKTLYFGLKGDRIKGEFNRGENGRNNPDYFASNVQLKGLSGSVFDYQAVKEKQSIALPLPGIYQIYNFLAAAAVIQNLKVRSSNLNSELSDFTAPFGRAETVEVYGKSCTLLLIKNPIGATSVFNTLLTELEEDDGILVALNDNFADGTDISWIWDAEFEKLKVNSEKLNVICSGSRAYDVAIRLKYAGFKQEQLLIETELVTALEKIVAQSKRVFILPTYTALLELQKILAKKRTKKHYWKE